MTEIFDPFQRKIDYLRISITDRCNLRCVYCMPGDGVVWKPRDEILSYEEISKIAQASVLLGINKFRITGGEPLVRKDAATVIREINAINGVQDISLTTNGLLFPELATDLKSAGLRRINISLDTFKPDRFETITRLGKIDNVLKSIDLAIQMDFHPVKVNVVVIRRFNDDELEDFIEWSYDKSVYIRFIEFMPNYGNLDESWGPDKVVPLSEIRQRCHSLANMEPVNDVKGYGPAKYWKIPGAKGTIGFISPLSDMDFCSTCRRIRLTADGKLHLCLHNKEEADLREPIRSGATIQEIADLIREGLKIKPKQHFMLDDAHNCFPGSMSEIGG